MTDWVEQERKLPVGLEIHVDLDAFTLAAANYQRLAAAFEQFGLVTGNMGAPLHALVKFWEAQESSELDAEPLGELSEPQHLSRFGLFEPE